MPKLGGPTGKQPGRGNSPFSKVPSVKIQRSTFDRSHAYKTTFDAGLLIPMYMDEALPGDTFTLKLNAFARLATPLKPLMDNLHMETFFFAVPNRLLWTDWERFNGAQDDPTDGTDFVIPQLQLPVGEPKTGSISDYMGIPCPAGQGIQRDVSALWHRAYNLIYNEWFRDQNLQMSVNIATNPGPDFLIQYELKRRGKRHDYFTSCLPWPQKSLGADTSVGIPVTSSGENIQLLSSTNADSIGNIGGQGAGQAGLTFTGDVTIQETQYKFADQSGLEVLVNQMRQSVQIQKLLERDARGGTRYTEIIRAHFGVVSPDSRLQRPEYLGGGYAAVALNPVAQTSGGIDAADQTPQANLAAIGTASLTGGFHKSFTEHCTLLGLVSVRADQTYQFGIDRMWDRKTRFDFYWPALAQIGEQAVIVSEINSIGTNADEVFGYQERYAEYRYKQSMVTGLFRSNPNVGTTLDIWHLAQDYLGDIILDASFIEENPPIARVIAVPSEPHFLYDSFVSLKCARPMPVFGTPGFVDHF